MQTVSEVIDEVITERITKSRIAEGKNKARKKIFIKFFNGLKNNNVLDIVLDLLETDAGYEQIRKEMISLTTIYNESDITDEELEDTMNKVNDVMTIATE